jgi:hypothetical protein
VFIKETGVQYIVVEELDDIETFQAKVNEHLRDGWKPLGGVAVVCASATEDYAGWWFYQAMIKAESGND